ncbi:hypothetical protein LOY85_25465 [Brevibacillus brevis]|uniref:hypothetical protein n=1 Tax=Brevibacillus brevis TaxID=1393 RepID=UPI001F18B6F1|nr:hypothetical protein [Brevibacillus brevis]UIO42104.1 hypothetical protein LOY85_25465 [Brevibacillus brevis]
MFKNGKDGEFVDNVVAFKAIDAAADAAGALKGQLSVDGKTLTVTTTNAVSKRYNVVIQNLKAKDGSTFVKYDDVVTFAGDTTAPTIVSTVKDSASTFTVTFSEPISAIGTVTYKYADGTPVTAGIDHNFTTTTDKVTFTMTDAIAAGKTVIATLIGTQDTASNLLTPNPATVRMVKGALDGVAPTVSTIAQTGATTFTVKFSEQLAKNPTTIKVGTETIAADKVVKDTTDPTLYHVTAPAVLDGAQTVVVSGFQDLSGENGVETSKVVVFTKDAAAPKVASSNVVVDATDSKQYLELTFDKDVTLATGAKVAGAGSFVKDHITNAITGAEAEVKQDATNKKVVRVNLDTFLGTDTDVEGATYNLDLTFTGVTSAAGVDVEKAKSTFTRGKDGVPASDAVVKVTAVEQGTDNNKVKVTFDQAVDGASATNAANYKIDGAVVESVTLLPAETANGVTTQVAVLNLKAGSNEFTGKRNINISDVKALGSAKVMEPYFTNGKSLNENVAPVVTSAKLTGTTEITLTFSEAVLDTTGEDFEVLIGGQVQKPANNVDAGVGADAKTTVKVTIAEVDADKIAKGLSLKALETIDVKDAAGNVLSVPANIVVTQ